MCSLWQLTSHPLTGSLLNVLVADVAALELRLEHVLVFPLAVALAVFVAFALALVVPGRNVLPPHATVWERHPCFWHWIW